MNGILSTSSGGITPTGEIQTAHSRTFPSAAVFITNLTRSGLGGELPVVIIVDTFLLFIQQGDLSCLTG
jgi:hypothetical protein